MQGAFETCISFVVVYGFAVFIKNAVRFSIILKAMQMYLDTGIFQGFQLEENVYYTAEVGRNGNRERYYMYTDVFCHDK